MLAWLSMVNHPSRTDHFAATRKRSITAADLEVLDNHAFRERLRNELQALPEYADLFDQERHRRVGEPNEMESIMSELM